jgi:hypothetical protein
MDTIFSLSGLLVLPFWALLIFLPTWRWTARLMASPAVAAAPALLYAALVIPHVVSILPAVMSPKLGEIAALLGSPEGAVIAWAHFLCFDLFVGRWIYLDARERGISSLVVSPILFFTLMLGPIGFLAYLVARAAAARGAGGLLGRVWRANRSLAALGFLMVALTATAGIGLLVDDRVVTGAPVWMKPAKFAVSTLLYAFTLTWLLGYVRGHERLVRAISAITAVALFVELAAIFLQAARGMSSHFNFSTTFDAVVWVVMGAAIVPVWVMGLLVAWLLVRERSLAPAFAWSLRLGMVVAVVGMLLGYLMTGPTAPQMEALGARESIAIIGGHSVGVADGGPGLPGVGWSTEGGDHRVAHFVGMHALQVLPFVGWLVMLFGRRFSAAHQTALVWVAGLAYLGVTLLLAWHALRGLPVVAVDATAIAAAAALVGTALAAALAVVVHGLSHAPEPCQSRPA